MFILKLKHIKHSYNICNMPFVKKSASFSLLYISVQVQSVMTIKTAKLKRH